MSIRSFNKHVLNRLTSWIARRSRGPFALVIHTGRRTSKTYGTPIIPVPLAGAFLAALTYGRNVDWYRNIRAAGTCEIIWHGRRYHVEKIEEMNAEGALPLYPRLERLVLKRIGTRYFLKLTCRPTSEADAAEIPQR